MKKRELLDLLERLASECETEGRYLLHGDESLRRYVQGKALALHIARELVDDLDD